MGNGYLEAITPENHDCNDFHPKDNQKAVYKWYDERYSDEAWDIYSNDWESRITEWHDAWHQAHYTALQDTNTLANTDEQLEKLPFGKFFLAHPIAAFSFWRVLQACYGLDRAVCGETEEVASWQQYAPFQYLRDSTVETKWQADLEQFKQQVTSTRLSFKKPTWESKLFNMYRGIETFDKEFAALKVNFKYNLVDKKFGLWMIERIEEDVGKRIAMITDVLKPKDNGRAEIQPTKSHEDDSNDIHSELTWMHTSNLGLIDMKKAFIAPGYSRTATFPPSYLSPNEINPPDGADQTGNTIAPGMMSSLKATESFVDMHSAAEPNPLEMPFNKDGLVSNIKKVFRKIKHKVRKSKCSTNPGSCQ